MRKIFVIIVFLTTLVNKIIADNGINTTDEYILYTHTVLDEEWYVNDMVDKCNAMSDSIEAYIKGMEELLASKKNRIQNEEQRKTLQFIFDVHHNSTYAPYIHNPYGLRPLVWRYVSKNYDYLGGIMIPKDLEKGIVNKTLYDMIPSTIEDCKGILTWIKNPDRPEFVENFVNDAVQKNYYVEKTDTIKNPFYNLYIPDGFENYLNEQYKGWEWAREMRDLEKVEKTYPKEVTYYASKEHPEYAIDYQYAYDLNGNLKYGICCNRSLIDHDQSFLKKIFLLDYRNNKYGILKEPQATQTHIQQYVGLKPNTKAGKALISMIGNVDKAKNASTKAQRKAADRKATRDAATVFFSGYDEKGAAFIRQLDIDHKDDLTYLDIRRTGDLTFKVIYMDSKGQSTYTAKVKFVSDGPFKAHAEVYDVKEDRSIKYAIMDRNKINKIREQLDNGTYEVK